ncbi:MAG TPA: DinB family protein [Flavisolibacter sp.]|nr:DinB family protein [Flavisolibacter sp.]
MEATFKIWKTIRDRHLHFLENHTLKQLNKVPDGFNNNLIWNVGHTIVAQQSLIYKSSGLPGYVSEELFNMFKTGTKPTTFISQKEVIELKQLLVSLLDKTITDFYNGKFITFNERITSSGFRLQSLPDAIEFNNYHEALHLGYMMSIRKFV